MDRKKDHIELALEAQTSKADNRFYYEPALGHHNLDDINLSVNFLGKKLSAPLWISSMTGGTERAKLLNQRFAKACAKYGLAMGLGSCRPLLEDTKYLEDFNIRSILGDHTPFYANLGIAQVEQLLINNQVERIIELVELLKADGLIVHINPLQEWLQPEGDRFLASPIETLRQLCKQVNFKLIVKEVGQGIGPKSLEALMELPLAAIEFGAFGGTNFSQIEWQRQDEKRNEEFIAVGHDALEMVNFLNEIKQRKPLLKCQEFIISGGVKTFLDGHYLTEKLVYAAIYGQASAFLRYALQSEEALFSYIESQIQGLKMAQTFLTIKKDL